jgi:hypothetical protein
MNVDRRFLYLGVFLVAMGGVLLIAQSAAITTEDVAQALRLWPVLVIALGIGLLLRRTRFDVQGGMLAAAMPGLLLGGVIVATPEMAIDCDGVDPVTFATRQGTFSGAASVELTLACGEMSVTTAPGSAWQLQTGSTDGAAPVVAVSPDRLTVASSNRERPFGVSRGDDVWRVALPVASTLDLAAEISAGRGRFDLAGAQLGDVDLVVNAGEARVDLTEATVARLSMHVSAARVSLLLPADSDLDADLMVNAGALTVCAAPELGLRIHHDGVLESTTFGGLVRSGDSWESPGYSMANHHADVTVSVNVGSVHINPVGGCR